MSNETGIVVFTGIHIVLILLGVFFRKSNILFAIQGLWMVILFGFNCGGMDFIGNENIYLNATPKVGLYDMFTNYLSYSFRMHGIDFVHYNLYVGIMVFLLLFWVISKFTANRSFVLSLIMIYPFVEFVIQKRYFYCMVLLVCAMAFLNMKNRFGYIGFCILVFIAMQFHASAAIFYVFVIYYLLPKKYRKKVFVSLAILFAVGYRFIPDIASKFVAAQKVQLYFYTLAGNSSFFKFIFWVCLHCSYIYLFRWFVGKEKVEQNKQLSSNVLDYNYISLVFMPLYAFDPVFFRLYRPIIIWNYICLANCIQHRKHFITLSKVKMIILQVGLCVGTFIIFYVLVGAGFDKQVVPIFDENLFLNQFVK